MVVYAVILEWEEKRLISYEIKKNSLNCLIDWLVEREKEKEREEGEGKTR